VPVSTDVRAGFFRRSSRRPILESATVVKHTKSRPTVQRSGVATKLTLRFPAGSFLPLQPEAIIEIQQGDIEVITVVASNPGMGDEPGQVD